MTIRLESVVVRNDEPIAAKVDGETVILSAQAEAYFGLGAIGSDIWEMIAAPRVVSELCAKLVEEYDVDPQVCERDTIAFLTKLQQDSLIRIIDGRPGGR
jgi:hypothetical protein